RDFHVTGVQTCALPIFPYMVEALEKILAGREINSLNIREQQMTFTVQQAQQPMIFLFGNGPSKDVMELVESIYTYYLFRYGAVRSEERRVGTERRGRWS